MINWSTHFDRIFCIFHLPYHNRMPRLRDELSRLGILDSGIFEWRYTTPSPYDKPVWDSLSNKKNISQVCYVNQLLELLRILKESIELHYERILVLEDDVAFLKDLEELDRILGNIPKGYDIIQLDKGIYSEWKPRWDALVNTKRINKDFVDSTNTRLGASGANAYTYQGMVAAVKVLEKGLVGGDHIISMAECKSATAIKNPCIQVFFETAANLKYGGVQRCHSLYSSLNINYDDYCVPVGYSYGKLFAPQAGSIVSKKETSNSETSQETNMSIWTRFDYVGVVCFSRYQMRLALLKEELKRVGLLSRAAFHIDFPNPFEEKLISVLPFTNKRTQKAFHCGYNNYCIIKRAFEMGCKSVLVIEDDVRFLKDVELLGRCIQSLPEDFDLAMFDKNWPAKEFAECRESIISKKVNPYWISFDRFFSSGCYAMSRKGMERFIEAYQNGAFKDRRLDSNDQYFNRKSLGADLHLYAAHPNACCQEEVAVDKCTTDLNEYWERHEMTGTHSKNYNLLTTVVSRANFHQVLAEKLEKNKSDVRLPLDLSSFSGTAIVPYKGLKVFPALFKNIKFTDDVNAVPDYAIMLSNIPVVQNLGILRASFKADANALVCEDGFIRSYTTPIGVSQTARECQIHSLVVDHKGFYYDATHRTDIETMLNDDGLKPTPEQTKEARRLIDKIVSSKISKYNHQPIYTPKIGREGAPKVLVVDQSYGDYSIKLGLADDSTFEKMLDAAIKENPDADILVKTHPDTIAGKKGEKKGYYQDLKEHDNIYKVTFPINPYSLMEICDKVYVCSSQFGLEALMAGKEVHTFGMPFYAGWGLTIDDQHLERRTNTRTLEELFYIFYCMYTHWVDPDKGSETTIDAVIDKMIELRKLYLNNPRLLAHTSISRPSSPTNMGGTARITHLKSRGLCKPSNIVNASPKSRGFVKSSFNDGWNW